MNVLLDSESVGLISGLQRTPRYNTHIRVIMLQLLIMLYIIMVPLHLEEIPTAKNFKWKAYEVLHESF